MMKRFVLLLFLLMPWCVVAQTAAPLTSGDTQDYFSILRNNTSAFGDKAGTRGEGYKQFRRWEWFWSQRAGKTGRFPTALEYFREWERARRTPSAGRSSAASIWNFAGPFQPSGTQGVGRLNGMGFHPTQPNTFWVCAATGGLWKTTDGGQTWSTTTDQLPVIACSDVAIDPQNPQVMYLGSGDADGNELFPSMVARSMGILKSIDGGNTWLPTNPNWSLTNQPLVKKLLINPSNTQVVLAATSNGIMRSANAGATWSTYLSPIWIDDIEFKPGDPNTVYAASKTFSVSTIHTSTDGGITWSLVASLTGVRRIDLAVSPNDPNGVQALAASINSGLAGLWYSSNSGATFIQYMIGNCSNNYLAHSPQANNCGGQGWYDLTLAINPLNANELWLGGVNTWKSTDKGNTWNIVNVLSPVTGSATPVVHADKHRIAFHPLNTSVVFECNDGGLFKTTDGGASWIDISNGLGISQIYRIGTAATANNMVIAGLQDNGNKLMKSTWSNIYVGDGMECFIDYTDSMTWYTSIQNGAFSKTTNGGVTWQGVCANFLGTPGVHGLGAWVTPMSMHPKNPKTLLIGKIGLYQSVDGGATFTQLAPGYGFLGFLKTINYAPSNPQVIYAADDFNLHASTDGGNTWTKMLSSTEVITYIAVHPSDPKKVWVTHSGFNPNNRVMFTSDGGNTWSNYSAGMPNIPVNCIAYQPGSNDALYAGTDLGVFHRDAGMSAWAPYNNGLPNVIVNELEFDSISGRLWAGTYGRGLWWTDAECVQVPMPSSVDVSPTVCTGAAASATVHQVKGASFYSWNIPAGWIGGGSGTVITFTPTSPGTLSVTASNSCGASPAFVKLVHVTKTPTPSIYVENDHPCIGDSVGLLGMGADLFEWYTGHGGKYIHVTPTVNSVYTATGTTAGCASVTSVSVNVSECTVLPEHSLSAQLTVYPNPSNGTFTIESTRSMLFSISNILGQEVFCGMLSADNHNKTEILALPQGVYFVEGTGAEHPVRIIVE